MKVSSDFKDILSCLNNEKAEYLLVGGHAVILHSEPRYTKDIDIWIRPTKENAEKVYHALASFGAPLEQLSITPADFEKEGYFVQLGREPARIDILMSIKGLSFEKAWAKRVSFKIDDITADVISREDLITAKLESGRPQDLLDAQALQTCAKEPTR